MNYTAADEARFWAKVNKTEGCWNWTAYRNDHGYGTFGIKIDGRWRIVKAHRMAYLISSGNDAGAKVIDHICHNTSCVNPGHLRPATVKQNQENLAGAKSGSISGIRGVSWNSRHSKWLAKVTHNQRQVYVGLYGTIAEAEQAVIAKRIELFTHNAVDRAA